MGINLTKLAGRIPEEGEWSEADFKALIGRIADIPETQLQAAAGAARAQLVSARLVLARQDEASGAILYRKNPNPPKPLSFTEQQQAAIDSQAAFERSVLARINAARKANDEALNGPVRQREAAAFKAQVVPILIEYGLLPADTPIPSSLPHGGTRIDYAGPPMAGSFEYQGKPQ